MTKIIGRTSVILSPYTMAKQSVKGEWVTDDASITYYGN
ncbi:hypothetical protein JOD18_001953 [Gracilibacillus alcaliphilus]|nr:hypothetical protein [Gracilibacillus alcaliphilus]